MPALSFRRHLAATQFHVVGQHLSLLNPASTALVLLAIVVLSVVAGYAPLRADRTETPETNAVYIMNCVLTLYLFVPVSTTMLLPAGRRERFGTAVALALANGLVVLAASLFLYVSLLGVAGLAPPLMIGGTVHNFRPADLAPAFVPLAVLALNGVLQVVCRRWLLLPQLLLLATATLVIIKGGATLTGLSISTIICLVSIITPSSKQMTLYRSAA